MHIKEKANLKQINNDDENLDQDCSQRSNAQLLHIDKKADIAAAAQGKSITPLD